MDSKCDCEYFVILMQRQCQYVAHLLELLNCILHACYAILSQRSEWTSSNAVSAIFDVRNVNVKKCIQLPKWIASLFCRSYIAVRASSCYAPLQLLPSIKIKNYKRKYGNGAKQKDRKVQKKMCATSNCQLNKIAERERMFLRYRVVYHCFNEN